MKFTFPVNKLKENGYKHNKLFARNYKVYSKEIRGYRIWLWVAGLEIEVEDWHQHTEAVINFYKSIKQEDFKTGYGGGTLYYKAQLNRENSFIQPFDYDEYFNVFNTSCWDKWIEKYENWQEIVFHKPSMDELIAEIEILQNNK